MISVESDVIITTVIFQVDPVVLLAEDPILCLPDFKRREYDGSLQRIKLLLH